LVFFGNERLATAVTTDAPTLRALVTAGYKIEAVVTNHTEAVSRNKRTLEIVDVAHAYHIPVLLPEKLDTVRTRLDKIGAEGAVLVAFGKIIPQDIIDIFPVGIINIHPSLLPKLRGSTPVESAILNGLEETGVSLMKLTAEMDAGPVYAQKKIKLNGTETKPQLAAQLLNEGCKLLIDNLDKILSGELKPKPQDETESTYTRLLTKQDGHIDFAEPADVIERKIRAFLGFPKARAPVFGREVVITKARLSTSQNDGNLVIKCNPGYLEVLELIAPSGRTVSGADFKLGYQKK
jgi:methionyl-tRNA formyltransferase